MRSGDRRIPPGRRRRRATARRGRATSSRAVAQARSASRRGSGSSASSPSPPASRPARSTIPWPSRSQYVYWCSNQPGGLCVLCHAARSPGLFIGSATPIDRNRSRPTETAGDRPRRPCTHRGASPSQRGQSVPWLRGGGQRPIATLPAPPPAPRLRPRSLRDQRRAGGGDPSALRGRSGLGRSRLGRASSTAAAPRRPLSSIPMRRSSTPGAAAHPRLPRLRTPHRPTDPLTGSPASYFPELDPAYYGLGHEDLGPPLPGRRPARGRGPDAGGHLVPGCGPPTARMWGLSFCTSRIWLGRSGSSNASKQIATAGSFRPRNAPKFSQRLVAARALRALSPHQVLGPEALFPGGVRVADPLVDALVERAPSYGVREFVIGMAHADASTSSARSWINPTS